MIPFWGDCEIGKLGGSGDSGSIWLGSQCVVISRMMQGGFLEGRVVGHVGRNMFQFCRAFKMKRHDVCFFVVYIENTFREMDMIVLDLFGNLSKQAMERGK